MIDIALNLIASNLDSFLKIRFQLNEQKVILGSLIDQDGKVSIQNENIMIMTLVDIAEEPSLKNNQRYIKGNSGEFIKTSPAIHLNLFVLFSAYFKSGNYQDALRYLSNTISFFQAKPVFTHNNTPQLIGTEVDKMSFEIFHQDNNAKNNLWNTIGAKYMPSVIYKVKLLTFEDDSIKEQIRAIEKIDLNPVSIN